MSRKRLVAVGFGLLVVLSVGANLLFHKDTPDPQNPYRNQLIATAKAVRSASGGKCRVLFRQGVGASPWPGHGLVPTNMFVSERYLFKWKDKGYIRLGQKTSKCITIYPVSRSSRVSLAGFGDCRVLGVLETLTSFRLPELSENGGSGQAGAYLLVLPETAGSENRFSVLSMEPDKKGPDRFREVARGPLEELKADRKAKTRVAAEFPNGTTVSIQNPVDRATIEFVFKGEGIRLQIYFDVTVV